MKSTDFVYFGGGEFTMGSSDSQAGRYEDESAVAVRVPAFLICKLCTRQGEYAALMNANPSEIRGEDLPVDHLSWFDAIRFCNRFSRSQGLPECYFLDADDVVYNDDRRGYRLPTAAEWEYACKSGAPEEEASLRADTVNFFPWRQGGVEETFRQSTVPCGSLPPDANGLFEMRGNVWEWCHNWHEFSLEPFASDPFGPRTGETRELRGGAWYSFARDCRPANRQHLSPHLTHHAVGFRMARSAG